MVRSSESEIKELTTSVNAEYSWSIGASMERFMRALKNKKLIGVRCPVCKKVFVPPRIICEYCFTETGEQVEVGPAGTVVSYTHGNVFVDIERGGLKDQAEPLMIILIKLDNADSCIVHMLKGIKIPELKVGMRVEVVWASETTGSLEDISHFQPVKQGAIK